MTAEAKAEKIIPGPVQEIVLEIAEGSFTGEIGSVRWSTLADGGLHVAAVTGEYGIDLIHRFADIQERFAQKGVVLGLTPEAHVDPLRPGEFCIQLTSPDQPPLVDLYQFY